MWSYIVITGLMIGCGCLFLLLRDKKQQLEDMAYEQELNQRRLRDMMREYTEKLELSRMDAIAAKDEAEAARAAAEQAGKSKSEFLANMSHEIRTPMNGVLGMAELLMDTPLTSEQKSWVKVIASSGQSLLGIINDILDISKIEAGRLTLDPVPFDLYELVEEVTDMLRFKASEKGIGFHVYYEEEMHHKLIGDEVRIRQILINLLSNAIKFTESGHVTLRINETTEFGDGDASRLYFEVRDTGIGIEPVKQRAIFDKFTQAEASTTRNFGGTGLGLSICQHLTGMMHGNLGVSSVVGEGSTFYFDLLLHRDQNFKKKTMLPITCVYDAEVLVLKPEEEGREIICSYLERWGMRATAYASIAEWKAAQQNESKYDLLFMDSWVAEHGLINALEEIREHMDCDYIPTILSYNSQEIPVNEVLLEAGFTGILQKPHNPQILFSLVTTLTDARHKHQKPKRLLSRYHLSFDESKHVKIDAPNTIPSFAGKRALVAEDIPMNAMLINKILSKHEVEVTIAINGREALQMRQKGGFDILFMDCQMPVMDGFDATRAIRAWERETETARIPIAALTADAMTGDREKCLDAGMDDYLNKPIRSIQITEMLEKWLGEPEEGGLRDSA